MRIGILANQRSWYAADLSRAIAGRGHESVVLNFQSLTAEVTTEARRLSALDYDGEVVPLNPLDAIVVRTMPPGSLEEVVVRMDLLAGLEAVGCQVVNGPRAIECAVDKYLTTSRLSAAGVPVPRTFVCESAEQALLHFAELGRDAVLKPLFGSEGRGIVRLTDEETAFRVFKALRMNGAVLYLQEFVQHAGFDVRLLVLDGEVVAAMKRVNELDFRTNVNQQATAQTHQPDETERRLAIQAAATTGARVAGVDIIRDPAEAPFVLEVNAVPGWKALSAVSGVDIAVLLVESIEKQRESYVS